MPMVNGKKYAYTKAGKAAAKKAQAKKKKTYEEKVGHATKERQVKESNL